MATKKRSAKRWSRRKTNSKALLGAKNPNYKLEQKIRAKALFLESNGEKQLYKIAKEVNVTPETIGKWRKAGDWDAEVEGVKKAVRNSLDEKLLASREVQSLLTDVSEEQLNNAVEFLVGKPVANAVASFLAKVHKQDMKDLNELNKAIRMHLRDGKIDELKPMDIVNLTNAKTNIIKNVRLIFGQSTENIDGDDSKGDITIILESHQADSLKIVEQMSGEMVNAG